MPFSPRLLATAIATITCSAPALTLASSETRLEPVVVSASGFEQAISEAPASITVIDRETLQAKRAASLAEALEGVEGVNVRSLDARSGKSGNQTISLRGLPSEYTLILIDGVRQNPTANVTPNAFDDVTSVFIPPIAAIERIEIIRGPMSTLYGSDAIGGVVNIITRKADNTWGGSVSAQNTFPSDERFGGQSTLEAYSGGALIEDTLRLQVYGRLYERAESNIRIPGTTPDLLDNRTMGQNPVGANVDTFGGRLSYTPNASHELFLRVDTSRQHYNNDRGQLGRLNGPVDAPTFGRGYSQSLTFARDQFRLGHVGQLPHGTLETTLTHDTVETRGRTINSGALDPSLDGTPRTLELETFIADTRYVTILGDHIVTVGGQYIDPEFTDGLAGGRSYGANQYSVFVEDAWALTDTLTLTTGLRYDDNENFDAEWTPRAYLNWRATPSWTLKAGAARGFRAPQLQQIEAGIIGFGDGGTTPIFGNPDLNPEKSTNYEVGAAFDNGGPVTGQVAVFWTDLIDKIEAGTGANDGMDVNIGRAVVQGVELNAGYRFLQDFTLSANYTYTDSEVKRGATAAYEIGDPLTSMPDHMVNATLDWQATPQLNTFIAAEYRSSGFRPRNFHEPQDGGSAQGAFEALGDFKGYTIVNLGAGYRFTPQVRANATLYNALNKDFIRYRDYPGRNDPSDTYTSNVYNNILDPRTLLVSLNVDF